MIAELSINQTCKRVLTYIRHHGFGAGDRLPTQSQMVEELGIGSNVLQSAMKHLETKGLIQRKPRMGTIFNAKPISIPMDWMIGIIIPSLQNQHTPFYAVFLEMVLTHLAAKGCHYRIYNFDQFPHKSSDLKKYNPGFAQDVSDGVLDALITSAISDHWFVNYCSKHKLELAIAKTPDNFEPDIKHCVLGGKINEPTMIDNAVALLSEKGCQHVCLVNDDGPGFLPQPILDTFITTTQQHGVQASEMHCGHGLILAGRKIGQTLLQLPAKQRPDGLIIIKDDHICLGLTQVLSQQSEYRPMICVQGCYQAPLAFALPVFRYEYDLTELVNSSVDRLLLRLLGHPSECKSQLFEATRNPAGPTALPPQWDQLVPRSPQPGVKQLDTPSLLPLPPQC